MAGLPEKLGHVRVTIVDQVRQSLVHRVEKVGMEGKSFEHVHDDPFALNKDKPIGKHFFPDWVFESLFFQKCYSHQLVYNHLGFVLLFEEALYEFILAGHGGNVGALV